MRILSWHGGELPRQSAKKLMASISEAKGPIVLPITPETINTGRQMAADSEFPNFFNEALQRPKIDIDYLAWWAVSQGKLVLPLYTEEHKSFGSEAGREAMRLHNLPEGVDARAHMHRKAIEAEAKAMLCQFERFRRMQNKPEIILAEDNHAIVLGRLFRTKISLLTKHSQDGRLIAKKTIAKAIEFLRRGEK